jgi:hypothetical protein
MKSSRFPLNFCTAIRCCESVAEGVPFCEAHLRMAQLAIARAEGHLPHDNPFPDDPDYGTDADHIAIVPARVEEPDSADASQPHPQTVNKPVPGDAGSRKESNS